MDKAAQHPLHINTLKVLAVVAFLYIHAWQGHFYVINGLGSQS